MERRHALIMKKMKSMLPRRESERRVHPLARHSDILTAIETRINMLRMTFMKYVDTHACCFIPGKVIDEILRILSLVQHTCTPPRTHEVLLELRDISSMAMEYFDEKIAPHLKSQRPVTYPMASASTSSSPNMLSSALSSIFHQNEFRKELNKMQQRFLLQKQHIYTLKNYISKLLLTVKRQNLTMYSLNRRLHEQSLQLKKQNAQISSLKRHVDEWDLKFADFVAEVNRARDETSSTRSSTSPPVMIRKSPIRIAPVSFQSNIKPRMAQPLPKSLINLDRKRKIPNLSALVVPNKMIRVQNSFDIDDLNCILDEKKAKPKFMSSSLEYVVKLPITSIQSRKRKLQ